jgi:hypothetical protein
LPSSTQPAAPATGALNPLLLFTVYRASAALSELPGTHAYTSYRPAAGSCGVQRAVLLEVDA